MMIELHVEATGKATAYTVLTRQQVDAIRGEPGRGRVNVIVRYQGHEFRTSISIYRSEWMFVVNKAMRAAGLLPGGDHRVELVRDLDPKRAQPAPDVLAALAKPTRAKAAWQQLAPSHKRQHLKHIEGAKRAETRARRIDKLVKTLVDSKKR
jgi:hypothetical protein